MNARATTISDLIRALSGGRVQQAIDDAVHAEASRIATALNATENETTVEKRGPADYAVRIVGPDVFASEFGSLDRPPERQLSAAMRRQTSGVGE